MSVLLSVDFDYFFPEPWGMRAESRQKRPVMAQLGMWDWGSNESTPECLMSYMWGARAMSFQAAGHGLPMCEMETGFWDQFRFDDDCKLYIANSHACILQEEVYCHFPEHVISYDAHHDCGYGRPSPLRTGRFTCEDWVYLYASIGATVDIVYPTWRDDVFAAEKNPGINRSKHKDKVTRQFSDEFRAKKPVVEGVEAVFICLSGTWVPPWCDGQFWDFVTSCPVDAHYEVLSKVGPPLERSFDLDKAVAEFNSLTSQMAKAMVVREKP